MQCPWRITQTRPLGDYMYTLELARGEDESAYVDVMAWETRAGDCHLVVVGAERDAVSQSAAAWVAAQPEHELAVVVVDWDLRRAS